MNWDREQATRAFKEEAYELLSDLETELLELEKSPSDMECVGSIFRALHTLKGTGSMFGFDSIARLVHEAETVFDLIRGGRLAATRAIIDLSLSLRDRILALLDEGQEDEAGLETDVLIEAFGEILADAGYGAGNTDDIDSSDLQAAGELMTYRIRFRPARNILQAGTNPIGLLRDLRGLGRCTIVAHTGDIPSLRDIDPELCYTYWDMILTTDRSKKDIEDVFIFVESDSDLSIEPIYRGRALDDESVHHELRRLIGLSPDITDEDIASSLNEIVSHDDVESGSLKTECGSGKQLNGRTEVLSSSIRVPSDKLDSLVDLVGEMVTVQARLNQASSLREDGELQLIAEEFERLTEQLRDNAMSLRMVPIDPTFRGFRRLVRDLSSELGKEVELTTEGEETELDKKVIEKIRDPLVHLIRNSIDHGIEPPSVRKAVGKPGAGSLHLKASHRGAYIHIEVRDDGKGFDRDAICRKAVERGLVAEDATLTDKEIYSLVFQSGFSTASDVTNVSGRGVGLDVVMQKIEDLRGTIEIDSVDGAGAAITLKLPLTLAIIEGLLVAVEEERFVIPLSTVEECIELSREDIAEMNGRHVAKVRGEIVPYVNLRKHFNLNGTPPPIEQVVVIRDEHGRVGFVIDFVVGELQTVIKSLGIFYHDIEGISGATILGDGRVALIMDVPKLIKSAIEEEAGRVAR